ncbi:hypothetical protein ACJ6WD_15560 [Streptomyces sp. VTCC 41912]|uniref:hypothetical protein n=1 Tax=Streptomyces TaxID=1883 RepID=UPI002F261ED3
MRSPHGGEDLGEHLAGLPRQSLIERPGAVAVLAEVLDDIVESPTGELPHAVETARQRHRGHLPPALSTFAATYRRMTHHRDIADALGDQDY